MSFFARFASAASLLAPGIAHANTSISGTANSVSFGLMAAFGPGFYGIVMQLRTQFLAILYAIAVFMVVWAGVRLITSDDEGKLDAAKRTIAATAVGIMLAHLSLRITDAFYGSGGALAPNAGAQILSEEIGGIIDFVASIVGVLAILILVVSSIRAVASFGKEGGTDDIRKSLYGVVLGIGLIVVSGAVKAALGLPGDASVGEPGNPSPNPIVDRIVEITVSILSFIALIAVGVIIYAGLLMVANFGNEEQFNRAKGIIQRAVIGLVVILLANVVIFFVMNVLEGSGGTPRPPRPPIEPFSTSFSLPQEAGIA